MKKVLTVGVFDYFHYGHLKVLEQAKSAGEYLIVAVQDSGTILKYKPQSAVLYTTDQRVEMVSALKMVDEVVVYEDVDTIVPQIEFDVLALGEDQTHSGFKTAVEWCEANGKKVVRLKRTPNISSTMIKGNLLRK